MASFSASSGSALGTTGAAKHALNRFLRGGYAVGVSAAWVEAYQVCRAESNRPKAEDIIEVYKRQSKKQTSGLRLERKIVLAPRCNFLGGVLPEGLQRWEINPQKFVDELGLEGGEVDLSPYFCFDSGILRFSPSVDLGVNVSTVTAYEQLSRTFQAQAWAW